MYHEVAARALSDWRLAAHHQLAVDTYAAQHAGAATPAIRVAFALLGLHWSLDLGLSGPEVRAAHGAAARASMTWPSFELPPRVHDVTVLDVAAAETPQQHVEELRRWAPRLWASWACARASVEQLTAELWPEIARAAARVAPSR